MQPNVLYVALNFARLKCHSGQLCGNAVGRPMGQKNMPASLASSVSCFNECNQHQNERRESQGNSLYRGADFEQVVKRTRRKSGKVRNGRGRLANRKPARQSASDEQLNAYVEERGKFLGLLVADRPFSRQELRDPALRSKHRVKGTGLQPGLFQKKRDHPVWQAGKERAVRPI